MKKIYTRIKITNYADIEAAVSRFISPDQVHSTERNGRVDTGATHLSIPEEIFENLGLRKIDERTVRYADMSKKKRPIASGVEVEINGRKTITNPVVSTNGSEILIGNPILEDLDFIVDTRSGKLLPNPESPDEPIVELMTI